MWGHCVSRRWTRPASRSRFCRTILQRRKTWKLRAPSQPGKVPLVAVMLYGTETGSPHGAVETPYGKQPLGGFTGSSGRVKFSAVATVDVQ